MLLFDSGRLLTHVTYSPTSKPPLLSVLQCAERAPAKLAVDNFEIIGEVLFGFRKRFGFSNLPLCQTCFLKPHSRCPAMLGNHHVQCLGSDGDFWQKFVL